MKEKNVYEEVIKNGRKATEVKCLKCKNCGKCFQEKYSNKGAKPEAIRIEMDEMWVQVKSKKESSWIWHEIDHDNRNVIAYIIGSREQDMLWQLTDILYNLNLNITSIY